MNLASDQTKILNTIVFSTKYSLTHKSKRKRKVKLIGEINDLHWAFTRTEPRSSIEQSTTTVLTNPCLNKVTSTWKYDCVTD